MGTFSSSTAVVTGANSGLGYEAAAQLAEAGYGRVVLACRSESKAEEARRSLVERAGRDPFEVLVVDVASIASANAAADEIARRGYKVDALLLNAGLVSGDEMVKTAEGLENSFVASIVGHHVLTHRLLEADALSRGAAVVLAGSEGAANDLSPMFEMKLYDFAVGAPQEFATNLRDAMLTFARGDKPELFRAMRHYATTKVFSAWWTEAMARRHGDRISVYTVSPGSNMSTAAARHQKGFKRFMFTRLMPAIGGLIGMDQPVSEGARRYVNVLNAQGGPYRNGAFFASPPRKITGQLQERTDAHFLDRERQEIAWQVITELTGTSQERVAQAAAAN